MSNFIKNLGPIGLITFAASMFALVLAMVAGWVMNIITLVGMISGDITAEFILRVVGIFVPVIGGVMGWF